MTISHNRPLVLLQDEIEAAAAQIDAIAPMERAFAAYSQGRATVPPVGEILFPSADGEAHIKSAYIEGDDVFVVKVATGFYGNSAQGLPTSSGAMLVFSAMTGLLKAVLLDGGYLTNLRTAAAGALAAKLLAPSDIARIGILGSGAQARLQALLLKSVTPCRSILLWSRESASAERCARDLETHGFDVSVLATPAAVAAHARLIVTTTPAKSPLLHEGDISSGTHITAVGSDTPEKKELAPGLVATADLVAVDSLMQSRERGELRLVETKNPRRIFELGDIVLGKAAGRTSPDHITIADLTGIAVQDVEIAKSILEALKIP